MREIKGRGFEDLLRDTGKYLQPTFDAAQDRAMREIRGSGMKKGRGRKGRGWEEMFRDTGKYLQPTFDAAQDRAMREIRGSGMKKGRALREAGYMRGQALMVAGH